MARSAAVKKKKTTVYRFPPRKILVGGALGVCLVVAVSVASSIFLVVPLEYDRFAAHAATSTLVKVDPPVPQLDKALYDQKMWALANNHIPFESSTYATQSSSTITVTTTATGSKPIKSLWPAKAPYPNAGALLPFNRIVAYYGNFYSKGMGVLGQYPEATMLQMLRNTAAQWQAADPSTPVIPALDYIAVTAQGSPVDGTYRARMPDDQIQKAIDLADEMHGIVILDVQVGLSTLPKEIPLLKKYLSLPNVHLAIDPEFSMKTGAKPGTAIGTYDATDVNYAANYLAQLVRDNDLPPKILIVHRFTEPMVTNYRQIKPLPEVQIVMDMDGWGSPTRKIGTYQAFIAPEPVQFTGFKLFYKNDLRPPSTRMLTPAELLRLSPKPIFIQYQ